MSPSPRARFVRHPAVIGGAVLALAASAFVGYGVWSRHGEVRYARGGAEFGVEAILPAAESPSAVSATPAAGPLATPSIGPLATGTAGSVPAVSANPLPAANLTQAHARDVGTSVPAAPRVTAGPVPRPSVPDVAAPDGAAPARPTVASGSAATFPETSTARAVPLTGRYGLAVQGSENVKFGPLSFCGREFPAVSELVVAPAQGEPDGSYNFDVRYYPGDAGRHDERQIYRYTRGGVEQGFDGATVECGGVRQASEVAYTPVKSRVRLPMAVGDSWTGKGGDDGRTESYRTAVTGTQTLTVAGERIASYIIETTAEFTGSETGTRTQRWWYAPSYAMPLRWTDRTQGSRTGATYTSELTVSVTSLPTGVGK